MWDGFQLFFVVKNVVYKHAQFNMHKQEANKTVDAFVTVFLSRALHYGKLHDELIRDRIVAGW